MIDTSRKQEIKELVEVNLQKDEDSVTSLGFVTSEEDSAVAYAGINSSTADQNTGKNEHLRAFRIRYPKRRRVQGDDENNATEKRGLDESSGTEALGRASFFTPDPRSKKETYQRVLRFSPPVKEKGERRLAAVASGLAPEGEVIVFNASPAAPSREDIYCRFNLGEGGEAGDVDISAKVEDPCHVAFCTDYEVMLAKVHGARARNVEPACVYTVPHPDAFASASSRPKLRSLRFLTAHLILILQNHHNRSGAELLLLELSPSASVEGNVLLRRRLRKSVKSATALTTSTLTLRSPKGTIQSVIAVAGQDNSITILTLDHPFKAPFGNPKFRQYALVTDAHTHLITSLTFSCFTLPDTDITKVPVQYLKLVSTSITNTVVVQTLPLSPHPAPASRKPFERYVLIPPGHEEAWQMTLSVIISAIVIALGAFLLQAFTGIRGATPDFLGAKGWLPQKVHDLVARPYMFENMTDAASTVSASISSASESASKSVVETIDEIVNSATLPAGSATEKVQESASAVTDTIHQSAHSATHNIASLLHHHHKSRPTASSPSSSSSSSSPSSSSSNPSPSQALLISHDPHSDFIHAVQHEAEVLSDETKHEATRWEHLSEQERIRWKKKLVDAGHVAEEQAEAVLKGVFFGSLAQAVGGMVG